jgi:hypothetical protein
MCNAENERKERRQCTVEREEGRQDKSKVIPLLT